MDDTVLKSHVRFVIVVKEVCCCSSSTRSEALLSALHI